MMRVGKRGLNLAANAAVTAAAKVMQHLLSHSGVPQHFSLVYQQLMLWVCYGTATCWHHSTFAFL